MDSTRCNDVLNKRGISVHFLIDNDGTIFQTLDMQHGAWHGSSGRVNRASVGVQIQAAQALWKAIESTTAVEYKAPLDDNGNTSTKYEQDVVYGKFAGIVSHYHCSKKKIDCGGMDIKALIEEIK